VLKNKFLFAALLWTIVVTVLSLITINSTIGSEIKIEYKDKYVHFIFYFVFVILWIFYSRSKKFSKRNSLIILFSAIGYGILMEIFQGTFTKTRTADVLDVLANSTGALFGLLFMKILFKKK
jgi:VanZ family protein